MNWACVPLAVVLAVVAALWLRTRRYRRDDDTVVGTLSPWWVPVAAAVGAAVATPFYAGYGPAVGVTYTIALVWALVLAFIDLEVQRLPDRWTLPAYPVAGVLLTVCCLVSGDWAPLVRAGVCAVATFVLFVGLVLFSYLFSAGGSGMGEGDVKLSGTLGALLGWFSWNHALYGLLTGFVLGGLLAALLLLRRVGRTSIVSYGPPLILGTYLWAAPLVPSP